MKSCDSEIKIWCERKYQDVVSVLDTDNVDVHVHAYIRGNEWIACDIFAHGDKSKVADITFSFGADTNLDDLYSPQVKDVVTLFELLGELTRKFNREIHFGMPEPTVNKKELNVGEVDEFIGVRNFASMCLEPETDDYVPEAIDAEMQQLFDKVFEQIKLGKTCHVEYQNSFADYLLVHLEDPRSKYYYLPEDTDLHYPIQTFAHKENLVEDIFNRARKYRAGVFVWLSNSERE